jgi:hypothetical protein
VLGCGTGDPIRPRAVRQIVDARLSFSSTTGSPGSPITLRGTVRNTGSVTLWYFSSCLGTTPRLFVWESDHHNVEQLCGVCPNIMCPGCADGIFPLQPGETIQVERIFAGTLTTCDGAYEVGTGDFRVEMRLGGYVGEPGATAFSVERSATFHWSVP